MPLTILNVTTVDRGGGAERAARELHERYLERGADSWLAAGTVRVPTARTVAIPNRARRSSWARAWMGAADVLPQRGAGFHVARMLRGVVAEPTRWMRVRSGEEDFDHPATAGLLSLVPSAPSALHLHNLHGGYFDLRGLPRLSEGVPTFLTTHDAWLLSGHCAHSLSCERWESGCGACPALWTHPAVPRDRTAFNWARKRDIAARSRLYVASPSEWLAAKVRRSILMPGVRELRVIPNGVDLSTFTPGDRGAARHALGLDITRPLVLVSAEALQPRTWRDAGIFRAALSRLGGPAASAQWVALGETGPAVQVGAVRVEQRAREDDDARLAQWFQAADAYVHPARADTFPYMVIEALACGTPVIATAVGGIPEQVLSAGFVDGAVGSAGADRATGALVPALDAAALARTITALLGLDASARTALGANAAADARSRFDIRRTADDYLAWMRQVIEAGAPHPTAGS